MPLKKGNSRLSCPDLILQRLHFPSMTALSVNKFQRFSLFFSPI